MSLKNEETTGIRAVMIFEIIGKPKEHLVETLNNIINTIDKEKGVSVKSKKIKEPVEMKNNKEFFTTFAEVEVEVEEILNLAILMFKYMPAHIDVISPEFISLANSGWSDIFSELARRLHGYDELARMMQADRALLERKIREMTEKKEEKQEDKKKVRKKKTKED